MILICAAFLPRFEYPLAANCARREIALNKSTSIEQELELKSIGRFLRFRQPTLLFAPHFETSSIVWIIPNLVSRSKVARSGWSRNNVGIKVYRGKME